MNESVQDSELVAISCDDYDMHGCPSCNSKSGGRVVENGCTVLWFCGECHEHFLVLATGVQVSSLKRDDLYPKLQLHPRPKAEEARYVIVCDSCGKEADRQVGAPCRAFYCSGVYERRRVE